MSAQQSPKQTAAGRRAASYKAPVDTATGIHVGASTPSLARPRTPASRRSSRRSSASSCSFSSSSSRATSGPPLSRRASIEALAEHKHGLSCKDHQHACLSCTTKVGKAYAASNRTIPPKEGKLPPNKASGTDKGVSKASPTSSSTAKTVARKGRDRALDACAICGVALSLPLVATDYVCVLAGGALGVLFIPFGVLFSSYAGYMSTTGEIDFLAGIRMGPETFGGLFGLLGYFIPTSILGSVVGHKSVNRLLNSKRISEKTASILEALLNPGPAILTNSKVL